MLGRTECLYKEIIPVKSYSRIRETENGDFVLNFYCIILYHYIPSILAVHRKPRVYYIYTQACKYPETSTLRNAFCCHTASDTVPTAQSPFFFFFFFPMATPVACVSSQARGRIRTAAASHSHNHSNSGSELHRQSTPQLTATWDP